MIEESRVAAGRARERLRHRLTSGDGWSRERGAERERERERERDWILLRELQQEQHEVNLQILLWRFFLLGCKRSCRSRGASAEFVL